MEIWRDSGVDDDYGFIYVVRARWVEIRKLPMHHTGNVKREINLEVDITKRRGVKELKFNSKREKHVFRGGFCLFILAQRYSCVISRS